jgi:cell shape-determining protein MreC
LWQWINSYGGLSDLRRYNAKLRKNNEEMKIETEALRQQNARLAELESKLDIVLQSSDSNLIPTISTDDN